MKNLKRKFCSTILAATLALSATNVSATSPTFNNITAADFDKIVKELSANFNYSTVAPASSLGSVWGFELGAVGGMTKTPDILAVVKTAAPNTTMKDTFYHGAAIARLGIPFGITAELAMIPKINAGSVSYKQTGGAAQWTITDVFFTDLPVILALKGYYTQSKLSFSQIINNSSTSNLDVSSTIAFKDSIMGAQAFVSKKFLVFEPYAALGIAKASGTLSVSAALSTATIFSSAFPVINNSANSSSTSATLAAGLDIRLLFLSLGAEYMRAFGKNSYSGRFSLRF